MKILIFGGSGYIGSELCRALEGTQNDVSITVFDIQQCVDSKVDFIEGDIRNKQAVESAILAIKPEVIINLAAVHYIPFCIENPDVTHDTNVKGVVHILSAINSIEDYEPRLIFASSASIYGSHDSTILESFEKSPNDIYGESKLKAEEEIFSNYENYVLLRMFNVAGNLDPNPHLLPKVSKLAINHEDISLGNRTSQRDYVHVEDVANAYVLSISAPAGTICNIGTGVGTSVEEMVDKVIAKANSSSRVEYSDPEFVRKADAPLLVCDNSEAFEELGWSPTKNLEQIIESAIVAAQQTEH